MCIPENVTFIECFGSVLRKSYLILPKHIQNSFKINIVSHYKFDLQKKIEIIFIRSTLFFQLTISIIS